MAARFAPVDLKADVGKLPAGERAALAAAGRGGPGHGRALPAPGVGGQRGAAARRCWRTTTPAGPGAAARLPPEQGPLAPARRATGPSSRRSAAKPRRRQLLPRGRDQGRDRGLVERSARPRPAPRADGLLHHHPPRAGRRLQGRPLQRGVPGRAGAGGGAAARGGARSPQQPTLKHFLEKRAAAFLSNDYYASDVAWMELDASIEPTIGPYEVYEDELVQLQGGVRGVHHPARRRRDRQADEVRRPSCRTSRTTCRSTPKLRNPEARRAGAHPRGERRLLLRRRQPRRADRRLQPAQRRARRPRRWAPSARCSRTCRRRSSRRCCCPSAGSRWPRPTEGRHLRRLLHPHPDARADARPGAPQHHASDGKRRPRCAPALQDDLQRHRGGQGRHLRPVGAAAADRQGRRWPRRWSAPCTRPSWPPRSAPSASASEAHGKGIALQLNTLLDAGAVSVAADGRFSVDPARIKDAVRALTAEMMTVQAAGDRAKAAEMVRARAPSPSRGDRDPGTAGEDPGRHRSTLSDGGAAALRSLITRRSADLTRRGLSGFLRVNGRSAGSAWKRSARSNKKSRHKMGSLLPENGAGGRATWVGPYVAVRRG